MEWWIADAGKLVDTPSSDTPPETIVVGKRSFIASGRSISQQNVVEISGKCEKLPSAAKSEDWEFDSKKTDKKGHHG